MNPASARAIPQQLELVPWGPHSFAFPLAAVSIPVEPCAAPRPRSRLQYGHDGPYAQTYNPPEYEKVWLPNTAQLVSIWWRGRDPIAHPVAVDITCWMPLPAPPKGRKPPSVSVKGVEVPYQWETDGMWALGTEDVDNLAKSILDAMVMAQVFLDDRLIVELTVRKVWIPEGEAHKPRLDVRIYNAGRWSERAGYLEKARALLSTLLGRK